MTDHSELAKEARYLADMLESRGVKRIIHALADIAEEHDKQQPTFDELLAASRTCQRAIKVLVVEHDDYRAMTEGAWTELRAAGHLAKRAVELADKAKGGA